MNWHLLALGLTPIGLSAMIIASADINPLLDYGGLGLAGAVVYFLCRYLCSITKQQREERKEFAAAIDENQKELKQIIREDAASRNRLAEALEERPCISGDKRIQKKE